ncbi:Ca2+:H+ antiporter [Thermosporothrix hazakensis]|jgi:Ca2+:H+ antiporter|uniref:Ca2+:H+ antiporter n=2 Tax=Thermosporothrix TaxID=768650 RepID=A0A326UIR5_THEHA|nr:hypothetical protein [Thermosporothrix hazakensis]PZW36640.1 Ca2+:H+ antiporter [Thermosporothrix hazakensis]BBH89107.1 hypothetical protein KTC_38580 [Thermosporothrix sp. COM3]GCE47290.1 hypothetical protein KTH_21590 [Thermosporothrix hazakensis]
MPRWLYFLLIFAVAAVVLDFAHVSLPPAIIFGLAALGIVPLAALIGTSVEGVAEYTGERIGGLLFATFGNATELIISIFALSEGLVDVVRASIIGAILGNALLALGISVCVGGFRHGRLKFEARPASQYASLFLLCSAGLMLPTIANLHVVSTQQKVVEHNLSDFIAVILLLGYIASIIFSVFRFRDHGDEDEDLEPTLGARSMDAISRLLSYRYRLAQSDIAGKTEALKHIDVAVDTMLKQEQKPAATREINPVQAAASATKQPVHLHRPPLWRSLLLLCLATVGVALVSEVLVGSIEPMAKGLGWNEAFIGLVFVPFIGALPEYFNCISMAWNKKIGMVLAASAGSSIQIALLVAPLLVLLSLFMPQRLDLVFSIVELAVLGITTFLFSEITKDGELVWLEGLLLILLFGMMAGTVFAFGA